MIDGKNCDNANMLADSHATLGDLLVAGASHILQTKKFQELELEHAAIYVSILHISNNTIKNRPTNAFYLIFINKS